LTLTVYRLLSLTYLTHISILIILKMSVTEWWITEFDHISVGRNSDCACATSHNLSPGGKNDSHFWNPWPQFLYSLWKLEGTTMKI